MMNRILVATAAALLLSSCGGTATQSTPTNETELENGYTAQVTTPAGLSCDVFDTNAGGDVSCDWSGFAGYPEDKTGSVELVEAADGQLEVSSYEDGHMCATFDGNKSGGISCFYPER